MIGVTTPKVLLSGMLAIWYPTALLLKRCVKCSASDGKEPLGRTFPQKKPNQRVSILDHNQPFNQYCVHGHCPNCILNCKKDYSGPHQKRNNWHDTGCCYLKQGLWNAWNNPVKKLTKMTEFEIDHLLAWPYWWHTYSSSKCLFTIYHPEMVILTLWQTSTDHN